MMFKQNVNASAGTSFFGTTLKASVNELIQIFGEPTFEDNTGEDKVNFEWDIECQDGTVFTVYDWKEYRSIGLDEQIEWHIGGMSGADTEKAKREINNLK